MSTAPWVFKESFSPCGQRRGSDKIAALMTFLLIPERLLLPEDHFSMMTQVSDSINFHLAAKWAVIRSNWGAEHNVGCR